MIRKLVVFFPNKLSRTPAKSAGQAEGKGDPHLLCPRPSAKNQQLIATQLEANSYQSKTQQLPKFPPYTPSTQPLVLNLHLALD